MKAYSYTAYTDAGRRKRGTVVAETETQAVQQLKGKGLFVSEIGDRARPDRGRRGTAGLWQRRLTADLQMVLTRQMAVLLGAELPIEAALDALRASGHTPGMDAVLARAKVALLEGSPLSDALEHSGAGFPRYYIAALRAGERSGELATVFAELADHLEETGADRAQISTALVYPAFVAAVSLLVCAILMTSVAPEIVAMFEISDRPLPPLTRLVLDVTDWVRTHLPLLAGMGLALVAGLIALSRIGWLRARRDAVLLRLPLVGRLMRQAAAVQYLRTLALVLTSRHAVLNATDSAAEVLTAARFRQEAAQVSEAVRAGNSLSAALDQLSFVPPVARQLIAAGEMSARLARMTERSAVLVENALSTERKRIAALLEPILMMAVGGFVLMVVLAVLLPIFDLQAMVAV
ncbi:type II secretion system F family protein [Ruegeria sp. PrR005]|uniref:Type II secretion system F family protein n=1 Tax=Ruegeria sp. PrR005 TaxID=2706882 RepID=A0A6B2NMT9_9RHOB|nr:type II secretion system F family protein [Ruegeria sp. PrR005]NDW44303.1 type II secretion system F family protein [Ruegeria sp. PrR005]